MRQAFNPIPPITRRQPSAPQEMEYWGRDLVSSCSRSTKKMKMPGPYRVRGLQEEGKQGCCLTLVSIIVLGK